MLTCSACGNKIYKKDSFTCAKCGAVLCGKHAYFYVDESNIAITKSSPALCINCYKKTYSSNIQGGKNVDSNN
jgi:hypothetical protein